MDMDHDAFADSAVERAANQGSGIQDLSSQQWPPQHIAHYNYDASNLSAANSFVDMNLNEDEDPMLGDVKSAEEQGLLSGDIDIDPRYKNNKNNQKRQKMNVGRAQKIHNNNNSANMKMNSMMKQGSSLRDAFRSKMRSQTKLQQNVHRAPETNMGCSAWCIALFYWIPIRYMCFLGSMALFILPFLDVRFQAGITFVEWLLYWYIQLFAIIAIFIESPTWILTRKIQLTIYKWCRLLRRTWGRAMFYITIALLTFAELQGGTRLTLSVLAGIYMIGVSLIMFMFSLMAAKQYRLMFWYMATGGNIQNREQRLVGDEYSNDDDGGVNKLESRVSSYYDALDTNGKGQIGASELHQFAEESLKRHLSNAERYTIQMFLDRSCNGYISKQDWIQQFCHYNQVKFL